MRDPPCFREMSMLFSLKSDSLFNDRLLVNELGGKRLIEAAVRELEVFEEPNEQI